VPIERGAAAGEGILARIGEKNEPHRGFIGTFAWPKAHLFRMRAG